MKVYLTDGWDVFETGEMTLAEIEEANLRAEKYTDGNIYWTTIKPVNFQENNVG